MNRRAAHDHGAGPTVIADGDFQPVRQQRVGRIAEHAAHVGRVLSRRIEVGVAGHLHRQMQRDLCERHKCLSPQRGVFTQGGIAVHGEQRRQARARGAPRRAAQCHERIDGGLREDRRATGLGDLEHAGGFERRQVQYLIANGHANTRRRLRRGAEHAVRQVLQGEVGHASVGGRDPALWEC